MLVAVDERLAGPIAKTQRTEPGLVVNPEQKIPFRQGSGGPPLTPGAHVLATLHQDSPPAIRRRVHEEAENRPAGRRILWLLDPSEIRVELEGVTALQPGTVVL